MPDSLSRRLAAEAVGSALLLAAVVGSGIMGERLAGENAGIALLANTLATGAALVALILTFAPISGAHLNPAMTLAETASRKLCVLDAAGYVAAQVLGAIVGVALANAMFSEPLFAASRRTRSGFPELLSETVATFGLLLVIHVGSSRRPQAVPFAVAGFITSAYWFTASTSFANPAVTLARSMTDTFAGIRPQDVPGFVFAQFLGAAVATAFCGWLLDDGSARAAVGVES